MERRITKKITSFPVAESLDGLVTLGVDGQGKDVQVTVELLRGNQGDNIYLQTTTTHIQWCIGANGAWQNLVALADLKGSKGDKGDTGDNIELRTTTTHVQWRVGTAGSWQSLVALSELKGDKGDTGSPGKAPVLLSGTTTTLPAGQSALATVVSDGSEPDGSPRYKLNLSIPKGADGLGTGDMTKAVYDANNSGTVDNSEKLGGELPAYYAVNEHTLVSPTATDTPATTKSTVIVLLQNLSDRVKALLDRFNSSTGHKHNGTDSPKVTYSDLTGTPALGTAAGKDVPASGNAISGQVVLGNDSRLSDARTPTAHNHAISDITDLPQIDFVETTVTVSGGVGTIAALTDKTIYRFSAALSQLVISDVAQGWTTNSMAQLCFTWDSSLSSTAISYGSSGITAFDDTTAKEDTYCEISIFNNKAKIGNGQ